MKTWITSDTHWGHANILKFNPETRQYRDVEHMNASMIVAWNSSVAENDLVYHLGDFAFMSAEKARGVLDQINGKKILIAGNHDAKLCKDPGFRNRFEEIHNYHEVNCAGVKVVMLHYPIHEWNQCHRGAVHFHGHVHGKPTGLERYRVRDAGMDATGRVVSLMDDMIADALLGEIKTHGDGDSM
jgi:calcineurin-like phosphoesterase family protein